jgi:filamentous hemagglutinin family protein
MTEAREEQTLAHFITDSKFEELPPEAITTARNVVLTILGTIVAGANVPGIKALVNKVRDWGGKKEATVLMYGGKVPAYNAALVNSTIARALDFDDAFIPGPHFGASSVPTAIAVSELIGGCSGKEFLTALILGSEVSARLNLNEEQYGGFDPTGICSLFSSTAISARLLHLTPKQIQNALALAFNRCSGSFQSHISGSLAVRLNQGFASQSGILCTQLAQINMTGPADFLSGIYGYFHLYGKDKSTAQDAIHDLGKQYNFVNTVFKKYPSCGATQASTDTILALINEHDLTPENVAFIDVQVTPSTYRLAGKQFETGDNPKVDGQFNIQYCIANALLRRSSRLEHFDEAAVKEPQISAMTEKISVSGDPSLNARGHTALNMQVKTTGGEVYSKNIDIASGFPGNPLTQNDHIARFCGCIEYAREYYPQRNINKIISLVDTLEEIEDIRTVLPLLKAKTPLNR